MRCLLLLVLVSVASAADATLSQATAGLGKALADKNIAKVANLLPYVAKRYASAPKKDKKEALKMVGKATRSKDLRARHAAFAALGEMRVEGSSKYLRRWLNLPRKSQPTLLHFEAVQAAGQIADLSTLAMLRKQSDHKNLEFAAAATLALGGYKTLPAKRRKALALDLIKRLEGLQYVSGRSRRIGAGLSGATGGRRGTTGLDDIVARKRRLSTATIRALHELTGQKHTTVAGWRRWRDKAKREADPF